MIKPLGINIKDTDYNVADGAMERLINWQYRDGALRPLPERLLSDIDVSGYHDIIMHKVGDEDQINVLGYADDEKTINSKLIPEGTLYWLGKIVDGTYTSIGDETYLSVVYTPGISMTILNGLLYFMGDGSSETEQYYYRLQFNNASGVYEHKDMYAWKELSYVYNREVDMSITVDGNYLGKSHVGSILIRFAFVLKTGEVVLHSPMYPFELQGLNFDTSDVSEGDTITNIHTFIPLDIQLSNETLYDEEISAINVYASIPNYETILKAPTGLFVGNTLNGDTVTGEINKSAHLPFYLIQTINKSEFDKGILLYAGKLDFNINFNDDIIHSRIDMNTIAAGEIMPVDNFSYHKIYGKIKSSLNRIAIERPATVLANGFYKMLSRTLGVLSLLDEYGYEVDTEDGSRKSATITTGGEGIPYADLTGGVYAVYPNGLLSYPDSRGIAIYLMDGAGIILQGKLKKLNANYQSANLSFSGVGVPSEPNITYSGGTFTITSRYWLNPVYQFEDDDYDIPVNSDVKYTSENRIQYALVGESSVFPAANSYRIGEGRVMTLGSNMVDPGNADVVAIETVGASDGIYTLNIDQSGNTLISSITRTENIPILSRESLLIDGSLIMVSDKGLIAVSNGKAVPLSYAFFPDQFYSSPVNATAFPNYDLISDLDGNTNYDLSDIVDYLNGSLLAYDGRRGTIWCSNPNKSYSLLFSPENQMWAMSTRVFKERIEFFGSLEFVDYGTIYSRYLTLTDGEDNLRVLSGEENRLPVFAHLHTRPIKIDADRFKKIRRLFTRCELKRYSSGYYIGLGLWGKQDLNRGKQNIIIAGQRDSREEIFPSGVRQDLPIGPRKGKYKGMSVLIEGNFMPDSALYGFDIDIELVNEKKLR